MFKIVSVVSYFQKTYCTMELGHRSSNTGLVARNRVGGEGQECDDIVDSGAGAR